MNLKNVKIGKFSDYFWKSKQRNSICTETSKILQKHKRSKEVACDYTKMKFGTNS